jgi:Fe-S oxidoreductase/nitrate reductase gamma subunit
MDAPAFSQLTREVFGNVPDGAKILFYLLSLVSLGIFVWGVVRRVRLWRRGKRNPQPMEWRAAFGHLWRLVLLQRRVRGRGAASTAHVLLFGGFMVLTLGTTLLAIEHGLAWLLGRGPGEPVFHNGLYFAIYEPVLELAGLGLLAGCAFFVWRRWKQPPEPGHDHRDWLVLALLAAIGVTGYLLEGLRIVREQTPWPGLSFVGALAGQGFAVCGLTPVNVAGWHLAVWWAHAVLALALIALFPFTRLLHAVAGTVRLAHGVQRLGELPAVSIREVEETGELGVARLEQFTRRQLVELDACVACGRCDEACPAWEAGKPLAPRQVVQDLRGRLNTLASGRASAPSGGSGNGDPPPLAGHVVAAETLWSCTTCSACVDVCPLGVNPLGFIVELRRHLVTEAQLRGAPALALQKTDRAGNPWGLPARDRMAWAAGLAVPTIEENPDCEVVYWVGCAAAYDRRLQKVARSVVRLLRAARVNFAVLGNQECCTGETARRLGDELLFQQLARRNLETFERHGLGRRARRLLAHCPHCVNSFRQDYAQLGGDLDVFHHTSFLAELVRDGRLALPKSSAVAPALTYHDPCYLARVQGETAAPRTLLTGAGRLREMPRHGRHTACCGAGGGRMWFDDAPDKRTGQSRVAEALATDAPTLAVSCPFCLIMTGDGLAARGGAMTVRDVAEILADALPPDPASSKPA